MQNTQLTAATIAQTKAPAAIFTVSKTFQIFVYNLPPLLAATRLSATMPLPNYLDIRASQHEISSARCFAYRWYGRLRH